MVDEDANRVSEAASATEVARQSGSTALVAAPNVNDTSSAMEAVEQMETCSSEPSENGEIPQAELTAEERQELKGKKRAREDSAREAELARTHVSLLKKELKAKGLSECGLKRDLVARLLMAERRGQGEEARPCMHVRER